MAAARKYFGAPPRPFVHAALMLVGLLALLLGGCPDDSTDATIRSVDDIRALTPRVKVLAMFSLPAGDYKALSACPWVVTIETYGGPVEDESLMALQAVTSLRQLEIGSGDHITDVGLASLAKCSELEYVVFQNCVITW